MRRKARSPAKALAELPSVVASAAAPGVCSELEDAVCTRRTKHASKDLFNKEATWL